MCCTKNLKFKINKTEFAQICLTIFCAFFLITTNTCRSSVQRTIIFFLLCLLYTFFKNVNTFKHELSTKTAVAFYIFEIYLLIFSTFSYGISTSVNTVLSQVVFLGGALLFLVFLKRIKPSSFSFLVCSILALWMFADLKLLLLCKSSPNIARYIVADLVDPKISCSVGAPYALAQSSCFIVIALVNLVTNRKYKTSFLTKVLVIFSIIIMGVTVYEIQSTITTLIMIFGSFTAIFLNIIAGKNGLNKKKKIILSLIIIVFICTFLVFKENIGIFLIKSFNNGNSVFAARLVEVGRVLSKVHVSNDISTRLQLAQQSIQTFMQNPILGNLYIHGRVSGGHCAILDIFSDYGLAGGLPFIMFFVFYFRRLKKVLHNFDLFIWLPFFIMSWLNPIALYQPYFSILFIVPSLYYIFEKYNKSKVSTVSFVD